MSRNLFYDKLRKDARALTGLEEDTSVFTELHSPGYTTNWAKAVPVTPGSYQVNVRQSNLFCRQEENFSAMIVRGKTAGSKTELTGYYPNIVNRTGSALGTFSHVDENEVYLPMPLASNLVEPVFSPRQVFIRKKHIHF